MCSLEKELEQLLKELKLKSGRKGHTAVSGGGGWEGDKVRVHKECAGEDRQKM